MHFYFLPPNFLLPPQNFDAGAATVYNSLHINIISMEILPH